MLISLIRHGEIAGEPFIRPARPVSGCLSPAGIRQAEAAAAALAGIPYAQVFASPYGRALETAERIFAHRDIPITIVDDLYEWLPAAAGAHPRATAIPIDSARNLEDTWKTTAGEGTYDMYARVVPAALHALRSVGVVHRFGGWQWEADAPRHLAIVAHGGSLNVLLSWLLRLPPSPSGAFTFDLCGVAHLEFITFNEIHYPRLRLAAPSSTP